MRSLNIPALKQYDPTKKCVLLQLYPCDSVAQNIETPMCQYMPKMFNDGQSNTSNETLQTHGFVRHLA
jgi:hypothetical protein